MKPDFRTFLKETRHILHCGATGTELMKIGGETPGPVNNATRPADVLAMQRRYADLGCQIVLANTFGMNPLFAAVYAGQYDWRELNRAGVAIAKEASAGRSYVLGNIGPVGEMLEPFGTLTREAAYDAYRSQAEVLAECGIDGFSVQTFFHLEDIKLAVAAVRDVSDLPVCAHLVFNAQGATMMGDTPERCYEELLPLGIDVFGHNCGEIDAYTLGDLLAPVAEKAEIPISALPNAGVPRTVDGELVYDMTNEDFRSGTEYLMSKGVRVLGGCCGVNAGHIEAIADLFG